MDILKIKQNGVWTTIPAIIGPRGIGITSITKTGTSGLTDTYTITFSDNTTTTFTLNNGAVPNLTIGTVTEGATAAATITGTTDAPVLNLVLPNANVPTRVSELENDAGYLTQHQDLSNYVQNTDYATKNTAGVIKIDGNNGIVTLNNTLAIVGANATLIKQGTDIFRPIIPGKQEISTFYGLAKAAGDTTQSQSSNAVGTYTNEAKAAIQTMLDVPSNAAMQQAIANVNTMKIHICAQGEYNAETGVPTIQNPDTQTFYLVPGGEGSNLFIEWAYVNSAWERFGSADVDLSNYATKSEIPDIQINGSSIVNNGIANIPIGGPNGALGVFSIDMEKGIKCDTNGVLTLQPTPNSNVTTGTGMLPLIAAQTKRIAFYGLAKAAGDTTQSQSDNAVGTYTNEAKTAIRSMLGVPATSDITVTDVKINNSSIVTNGIANVPIAAAGSEQAYGLVRGNVDWGTQVNSHGELIVAPAGDADIQVGISFYRPITPASLYKAVFYGLARAAGDGTQMSSQNPIGTYTADAKAAIQTMLSIPTKVSDLTDDSGHYTKPANGIPASDLAAGVIPTVPVQDVQVNGVSVLSNGVANVGLMTGNSQCLTAVEGHLGVVSASSVLIKNGTSGINPIVPKYQHESVFYGLSKAAGVDLASEAVTLGTYPTTSQTAIKTMLGVEEGLKVVRLI